MFCILRKFSHVKRPELSNEQMLCVNSFVHAHLPAFASIIAEQNSAFIAPTNYINFYSLSQLDENKHSKKSAIEVENIPVKIFMSS